MKEIDDKKSNYNVKNIVWMILAYFIMYSIIGFLIETVFGILTKGVIESRQGFLYGPFCPIYGLGAVIMILSLKKFTQNNYLLFFMGTLVGGAVEYLVSLIGEIIFNTKWWDYSDQIFNINGRVCLSFSLFWGLLAIYLMKHLNPIIDKLIAKIKGKASIRTLKILLIIISVFLLFDMIITCVGLKVFYSRLIYTYDLNVENKAYYIESYEELMENKNVYEISNKLFSNQFMLRTFPNLKIEMKDKSIVFVKDLLYDIQPYYIELFVPKNVNV